MDAELKGPYQSSAAQWGRVYLADSGRELTDAEVLALLNRAPSGVTATMVAAAFRALDSSPNDNAPLAMFNALTAALSTKEEMVGAAEGWVSVNERLPPDGNHVLVRVATLAGNVPGTVAHRFNGEWAVSWCRYEADSAITPTHWMSWP